MPVLLLVALCACNTQRAESQSSSDPAPTPAQSSSVGQEETIKIQITVGDTVLEAVPEDNSSAEAFVDLLQEEPLTVEMSDFGNMEKVGSLGRDLPRNDRQITVAPGDVILYQGNQITIYYDANSWNFTKLATIPDATQESLLEILGSGDVTVTFSVAE